MDVIVHEDVKAVAEFMQARFPANRLVSIANGMAQIAPLLWGHFIPEEIAVLRLHSPDIATSTATSA